MDSFFICIFPTIIAAAFSLLFQFLLALVVLFLVIIPNLGSTAHIWKKHMSHIGSPKKRLGSRVLHLVELKKQEVTGGAKCP